MTGLNIVNAQHAVPLAPLNHVNARVRADAVVVEQPLDIYGQISARDETGDRNRILDICGLFSEGEGCYFGRCLGDQITYKLKQNKTKENTKQLR